MIFALLIRPTLLIGRAQAMLARRWRSSHDPFALMLWCVARPVFCALLWVCVAVSDA